MKSLYDVLGVAKDAATAEIKKAFKRMSAKHHPDRNGNSAESNETMAEINHAMAVLGDDGKRKHYDETGRHDNAATDEKGEARSALAMLFSGAVDQSNDIEHRDILLMVKDQINANEGNMERGKKDAGKQASKYTKVLARLSTKGKDLILIDVMNQRIKDCNAAIAECDRKLAQLTLMRGLLADYEYQVDEEAPAITINMGATSRADAEEVMQKIQERYFTWDAK